MKLIALMLVVTVPCLGWAQATGGLADPQTDTPVAAKLLPRDDAPPAIELVPTPLYERWYFWAGAAVFIAASVATAVAIGMATQQPPLTATQICGPAGCTACIGCR
jgi:hypothetical protein